MRDLKGKAVLVTGAAGGIGRATALAFARKGARLILSDVDAEGLERVASEVRGVSEVLLARVVDVARREGMASFAQEVHRLVPAVDVLDNNAGVGHTGGIVGTPLEDFEWILGVNLWGVIHGCHYFVPKMVERGQGGHVVNLSSFLGYFADRGMLPYATTKFAVFGLSESLRQELKPHGIGVSTICPGIVNTNIIRSSRLRGSPDPEGSRKRLERLYRMRNYPPEKVARAIVRAVERNRGIVPVSPESWFMYYALRLSPALAHALGGLMSGKMVQ